MTTKLTIEDLVKYVVDNNDYDTSGILVGVEQEAQSQYPTVSLHCPDTDRVAS